MTPWVAMKVENGSVRVYPEPIIHLVTCEGETMNIYDLQMESISGEIISFSDFRDQALLVVNLASQ